jgi:hypothetical protein
MANPQRWEVKVLDAGRCEPLKAAVHGVLFVTAGVCAAYNAAAWLRRRQRHLAINTVIYSAAVLWERCHVAHHLAACESRLPPRVEEPSPAPTPQAFSDAA